MCIVIEHFVVVLIISVNNITVYELTSTNSAIVSRLLYPYVFPFLLRIGRIFFFWILDRQGTTFFRTMD